MRTLLAIALISVSAQAYQVPKDAVIKVFDASGKQLGEMSRSEYKVVKLEEHAPKKQVLPEAKEKQYTYTVILHAGAGPRGLTVGHDGTSHTVRENRGAVVGATGCVSGQKGLGLCGTALSNQTYQLGVKLDF